MVFSVLLFWASISQAQSITDSITAHRYYEKAKRYLYVDYDSADWYFLKCMSFYKKNDFHEKYTYCLLYRQIIYGEKDDIESLRQLVSFTRNEVESLLGKDHSLYYNAMVNEGAFYMNIGNYDKSLALVKKALHKKISKLIQDKYGIVK